MVGFQSANPNNIAWLQVGDPALHYLGWAFFREGPWTWPIGLNPNLGTHLASSIVYADSIPLLAFLLKPFSTILPEPFQYLGLFIFLCFILQAIFAWLLLALFTPNYWIRFFGSALLLFAPPMMGRNVMTTSLAAHFLILAALFLALRKTQSRRIFYWVAVLCATALIHAYILGMVLAVWFGSWLDCYLKNKSLSLHKGFFEIVVIVIALGFICWQAGYFAISLGSGAAGNYGLNGLNLFAFFDPSGWSHLLKVGTPYNFHTPDGFQFLGLGVIFLFPFAAYGLLKSNLNGFISATKSYSFLFFALVFLTVFAFTQNIHIGQWELHYWLPERFIQWASIFRASSRMVWPVWYMLVFILIWMVARSYSLKTTYIILGFASVIQIADTSAGWYPRRVELLKRTASPIYQALPNSFWQQIGGLYSKVVRVPYQGNALGFEVIANYAKSNHLAAGVDYFARMDQSKKNQANLDFDEMIKSGNYPLDGIYFLDKSVVMKVLAKLNETTDLLFQADDQVALAPNWHLIGQNKDRLNQIQILKKSLITPQLSRPIFFTKENPWISLLLISGWGYPESWGTWLSSQEGAIDLLVPDSGTQSITLNLRAFLHSNRTDRKISIDLNGGAPISYVLKNAENNLITIPIKARDLSFGYVHIQFHVEGGEAPSQVGMGSDDRKLTVGLISATFN